MSDLPLRHILIVDDDPLSRDVLSLLLEQERYLVHAVASGQDALHHLQTAPSAPTAILSDIQMPGLSGPHLARELRAATGRTTLLFAMSGSQPAAEHLSGYDGFLLKPFAVSNLSALLQSRTGAPTSRTIPSAVSLDESIYNDLLVMMPATQVHALYELLLTDSRKRIASMREAAALHDHVTLKSQAHALKGSCGMVGAHELQALATCMEQDLACAADVAVLDSFLAACERLERILESRHMHPSSKDPASLQENATR